MRSKSRNKRTIKAQILIVLLLLLISACAPTKNAQETNEATMDIMKKPLVTNMYTADPSAHMFDGKLYIYPSHDLDHDNPETNEGDQFDMEDYHVFSMENMQSPPTDHGEVLNVKDVPWATMQMWAPDAAFKDGTYFLYFPARDKDHIFRIGVATSKSLTGPFTAESNYIEGSFSIDPCVFVDDGGQAYMYFGGLWGGQLEKWKSGEFIPEGTEPRSNEPALGPRVAKLSTDMLSFDGTDQEISFLNKYGAPLLAGENDKRFFEASWMHKYNGGYYFSYSTGDTHYIAYATGTSPTVLLHSKTISSILSWVGQRTTPSLSFKASGTSSIMKVAELTYNEDRTVQTIDP